MEAPKRRISLSKKQLETDAGLELLNICQSITADGKIANEEIHAIQAWLSQNSQADIPAVQFLSEVLSRALEDQIVTEAERKEIAKSIEAVLPQSERKLAVSARRQAEIQAQQLKREADEHLKQKTREIKKLNRPLATTDFMVAGTRHDGRSEIIDIEIRPGSTVILKRDRENRHSRFAIAVMTEHGECIGHVPEDYAEYLAPIMDEGASQEASVKKVLEYDSGPVPVIVAHLYDPRSERQAPLSGESKTSPSSPRKPKLRLIIGIMITLFVVAMIAANN
ncbi:HIRAN domain-containing protein [Pseudomonas sp. B21-009]|uniref:HIRAN domain-containing protein n=1 Tax=Pseudomonas sp. B21-009 TaxID=2895470 RepID=UPI00215E8324|nr:HIRAN domain-containing protein [Pseudomonas sp. B21-009]UVM65302.1 HIRAN domain-containing protein [Pseudomonas sp. B21-009]